jgi:hypothetical protein
MHCYVHTYAHTHVPSRARLACALTTHPTTVGAIGRAGVSAAAAALTGTSGSASRPPPAAPRARRCAHACAPTVRPRRAAPAHPERAAVGRARQPCARGARPRPTTGAGRTVPPRACTGRATRGAPSPSWRRWSCRAPRARAARARRAPMGRRGDERAEAMQRRPRMQMQPNARASARASAQTTARPHARLGAAPKYMHLNIDGCPCTLYIQLNGWRETHVPPIDARGICLGTHTHRHLCAQRVRTYPHTCMHIST